MKYKKTIEHIDKHMNDLLKDLQTLIIVPEKNLIPGLINYFNEKNMKVLEYHSSLTPKKKFVNWNLIQSCKIDIIIGTHSVLSKKILNMFGLFCLSQRVGRLVWPHRLRLVNLWL